MYKTGKDADRAGFEEFIQADFDTLLIYPHLFNQSPGSREGAAALAAFGGPFFFFFFNCPDTFYMTVYRVGKAGCPHRVKTT